MRHGKSDWNTPVTDFERPLNKRGIGAAGAMGAWLQKHQLLPDIVISSPAERAIQTTTILVDTLGLDFDRIQQDKRIYAAGINDLLEVLFTCPEQHQRILLVGHNPGLETLLIYLLDQYPDIPDNNKLLPTATLARLTIPIKNSKLSRACAGLLSITRPADLN